MGHSPCHAGLVALVLNPTTGHVSPQFHIVFDDTFSTGPYMRPGTVPEHRQSLVHNSTEISTDKSFDIAKTWFEGVEDTSKSSPRDAPINSQSSDPLPLASEDASQPNEGAGPANE